MSVDLTPIIGSTEDNAVTALALLSALIVRDFAATRLSKTFSIKAFFSIFTAALVAVCSVLISSLIALK